MRATSNDHTGIYRDMTRLMRIRLIMTGLLVAFSVAACEDTLTLEPSNEVPAERAIVDATSAYAALAGAYDALQDDAGHDYLSGSFTAFGDLPSDDVVHVGTFDTFLEADLNDLLPDNGTLEDIWGAIYVGVSRTNRLIEQVPNLANVSQAEKNDILSQAHFLRALHYHNLVKLWGGVPLRLTHPPTAPEAAQIARSTVDQVYTQILADLAQARTMSVRTTHPVLASRGAIYALRSRVLLYRGDWAGVVANADSVMRLTPAYELVSDYGSLFSTTVTTEDILRVVFTPEEEHFMGWWYRSKGAFGGRYEIAPSCILAQQFDADVNCSLTAPYATYNPTDQRANVTVAKNGNAEVYGNKWPTGIGDEGIHVIRFAEVILNKAEALARLGDLVGAVTELNKTRVRAGIGPYVPPVGATQQQILDAVWQERRLELAFEGHRWPDLVRTGRAVAVMGLQDRPHQVLFPIPQQEIDVTSPPLSQNPGY
jgi:hypothetical protein